MDLPGFKEREGELKERLGEVQWWMEGEVTLAPSPSSHAQDTHTSAAMEDRAGLFLEYSRCHHDSDNQSIVVEGEYQNISNVIIIVTTITIFQLHII